MIKLRLIPGAIKLLHSINKVDHLEKSIKKARESGDIEKEKSLIADYTFKWACGVAKDFSLDINVVGKENIPKEDGCVFISNHQGYADIIVFIIALDGKQIGFVAKDTLEKVPYLGRWIKNIRGIYIKRGNAKEALKSISAGSKLVKQGFNLAIFPEGTRSKGSEMAHFKAGSLKLATKAKAPIVPVTINGSYNVYEKQGYIKPAKVDVIIHPPVYTDKMDRTELAGINKAIEEIVKSGLS